MMVSNPELKHAIVVAEDLPAGLAVNAASVLAVTLGVRVDDLLGGDVADADGVVHPGIIYRPLPVLRAGMAALARIVQASSEDDELFCAAFSSLAQSCKTYDEYALRISETPTDAVHAVAVALVGPKKKVNKLVGSLPLLR